ncbi:MAG: MarR family transcriptional regulator, partial [Chitinivibrionales bacterium]|nr:MarR family transcriptional regulator [Chitinivibrionales bacterium]
MHDHEVGVTARSVFADLSVTQIHYLDAIRHLEKPTISELAKHQKVSRPTVTIALEKLARQGYLTKVSSLKDHRVSNVHLTKKGLKISELHDKIHQGYARYFENALGKAELGELVALLNKVIASMGL